MSYNFQANSQQQPQPVGQEHSMGSLLFGAFLGGVLPEVDMALDAAEAVGEIRAERFQAEAKRQGNVSLDMQAGIGGAFQNSVEGIQPQDLMPKSRYLSFDYGYKRKGMSFGMAA